MKAEETQILKLKIKECTLTHIPEKKGGIINNTINIQLPIH